jgi:DNA repair exonuclease SbcCD ATPase subunit
MANTDLENHVKREEQRLERIEQKIDKLSDAMIDLARAEEKLLNMEKTNQQHFDRMNRFSVRMDEIEDEVTDQGKTVKLMQFILSIASTALVGAIIKLFFEA